MELPLLDSGDWLSCKYCIPTWTQGADVWLPPHQGAFAQRDYIYSRERVLFAGKFENFVRPHRYCNHIPLLFIFLIQETFGTTVLQQLQEDLWTNWVILRLCRCYYALKEKFVLYFVFIPAGIFPTTTLALLNNMRSLSWRTSLHCTCRWKAYRALLWLHYVWVKGTYSTTALRVSKSALSRTLQTWFLCKHP